GYSSRAFMHDYARDKKAGDERDNLSNEGNFSQQSSYPL
ncbi:unnamed protein product, partial [marine sediment metagenome]